MISGAHSILYSRNPDADRAFLRDVLGLPHVDVGQGWLIFGLPPAEVAVHPSDSNDMHELYLICEDIEAFVAAMRAHGIGCGEVLNRGWGLLVEIALPGGGNLGVYQPRHARPPAAKATPARKAAPTAGARKKPAKKAKPAAAARRGAAKKTSARTAPAKKSVAKKTARRRRSAAG